MGPSRTGEKRKHVVAHSYTRQQFMDRMGRLDSINVVVVGYNLDFLLLDVESIKSCPSNKRHPRTKVFATFRQYSTFGCLQ